MSTTNFTRGGTLPKTSEELLCSPSLVGGLQPASFASVNILLSITTFLSNSLILVALHKESALHAPSKLLYRCLATTDLLDGLSAQPLYVTCWMSVVHEHWTLCYYEETAAYIIGSALCGVSLLTMAAISVDRLLTHTNTILITIRHRIGNGSYLMPHSHQSLNMFKSCFFNKTCFAGVNGVLVFFNSTLNPFLYCWKITKARRAMKQTIRHALCCPWS
ncbi:unnamed protein product [Pocillopora meandrina]|uniref:G-protein coupled receptors family 1 profile domain-containing protein n=1 Tax=Pocillopora meandrina TaxID=46732 RepID=A0AAU9Y309_9CNID|nr:unnamed protein product [Pocillopora meandrina]